ncbi:hypothetical protein AMTRI_Chr07g77720 [Amborella trichopoda]
MVRQMKNSKSLIQGMAAIYSLPMNHPIIHPKIDCVITEVPIRLRHFHDFLLRILHSSHHLLPFVQHRPLFDDYLFYFFPLVQHRPLFGDASASFWRSSLPFLPSCSGSASLAIIFSISSLLFSISLSLAFTSSSQTYY